MTTYTCKRCGDTKPADGFYKLRGMATGLDSTCKACRNRLALARESRRKIIAASGASRASVPSAPPRADALDRTETPLEAAKTIARRMSGRIERWTWGGKDAQSPWGDPASAGFRGMFWDQAVPEEVCIGRQRRIRVQNGRLDV